MNILQEIVIQKQKEVAEKSVLYPAKLLEQSLYFNSPVLSMCKYLTRPDKSGVIAEFKRRSPSRGVLNKYVAVEKTSIGYMQAGASALSVLTDAVFFGGDNKDLITARQYNYCPILRKDFIVDEYQIVEARSIGADTILLIAAILDATAIVRLARFAKSLQLEIILEVHTREELDKLCPEIDIVGVNNRDLKTFTTDVQTSVALRPHIPEEFTKISESGIHDPETAYMLQAEGFDGFLIGEQFMTHSQPDKACAEFVEQLNNLYANKSMRLAGQH